MWAFAARPYPWQATHAPYEVFFFWRELVLEGELATPFTIVHVDAHADLGSPFPRGGII